MKSIYMIIVEKQKKMIIWIRLTNMISDNTKVVVELKIYIKILCRLLMQCLEKIRRKIY